MNRETAIKAIEAWRANPATTFTPANILREFGDDILEGLRASAPTRAAPNRDKLIKAIRAYCLTVSPAAVQNSHGEDRIYYSGLLVSGLADFILAATASPSTATSAEPVAFMFWNEPDTQRHFSRLRETIGSHWTKIVPLYASAISRHDRGGL